MNANMAHSKTVTSKDSFTELDILLEIGSMGAGHATTSLSKVLHEPIKIEVPRVHMLPPHLVPEIYEKHDTVVATVFMQLRGTADCDIMLIFEEEESKKIAELMIDEVAEGEATPEMERSAIEEMGSIVLCSFLNAMADFTLTKLVSTPPQLIIDSFDSIMDGLLIKQALCSEIAVIFDARFKRYDSSTEGFLITFPSDRLQRKLAEKGKKWLNHENSAQNGLPPDLVDCDLGSVKARM
ncbi:MAG: chemotaxis protein CheC [Candidatus Bathyarchaeota archaeon]|nr:chemotaxis protein CheC [Candidatus Bathyarchaeota archaeon]